MLSNPGHGAPPAFQRLFRGAVWRQHHSRHPAVQRESLILTTTHLIHCTVDPCADDLREVVMEQPEKRGVPPVPEGAAFRQAFG